MCAISLSLILFLGGAYVLAQKRGATSGPSSSESPYVIRGEPGVVIKSILTVGDSVNLKPDGVTPYRMVGIPDGLGAFDNGDGTFTLIMNTRSRRAALFVHMDRTVRLFRDG